MAFAPEPVPETAETLGITEFEFRMLKATEGTNAMVRFFFVVYIISLVIAFFVGLWYGFTAF